jgi:hypothetical protein
LTNIYGLEGSNFSSCFLQIKNIPKWLTFILKYGEDDYVKYKNINEKTFLEKTALSRKNKSFIFPIFVQKGSKT